jgi:mRNA interferase MazF
MVKIDPDAQNGLRKPSAADALQIRSVSQQRLENKPGVLSSVQLAKIVQAVMIVLQR